MNPSGSPDPKKAVKNNFKHLFTGSNGIDANLVLSPKGQSFIYSCIQLLPRYDQRRIAGCNPATLTTIFGTVHLSMIATVKTGDRSLKRSGLSSRDGRHRAAMPLRKRDFLGRIIMQTAIAPQKYSGTAETILRIRRPECIIHNPA